LNPRSSLPPWKESGKIKSNGEGTPLTHPASGATAHCPPRLRRYTPSRGFIVSLRVINRMCGGTSPAPLGKGLCPLHSCPSRRQRGPQGHATHHRGGRASLPLSAPRFVEEVSPDGRPGTGPVDVAGKLRRVSCQVRPRGAGAGAASVECAQRSQPAGGVQHR